MADQEKVVFDQKEQTVKNQTNVAGDLNVSGNYIAGDFFANAQNQADVVKVLEKLLKGINQAAEEGQLEEDTAVDVESNLKKAITRAKKPKPDKTGIIGYLNSAKGLIEGVTSVSGLVTAVTKAVEAVQKFF
jgi:hypothetical protein